MKGGEGPGYYQENIFWYCKWTIKEKDWTASANHLLEMPVPWLFYYDP